jgi:hypothetical protein
LAERPHAGLTGVACHAPATYTENALNERLVLAMNLEALTQIPLADLGMGVVALVLLVWVSRYARRHRIAMRMDSPAHKFADELQFDLTYQCMSGNINHHDDN